MENNMTNAQSQILAFDIMIVFVPDRTALSAVSVLTLCIQTRAMQIQTGWSFSVVYSDIRHAYITTAAWCKVDAKQPGNRRLTED